MTTDDDGGDLAVYELGLAEARAGCQDLLAQPEVIRKNVGSMLGFSVVAASLFGLSGGSASPTTPVGSWAGMVGILAFVALGVCAVLAMRPVSVRPGLSGKVIVGWADEGTNRTAATRDLALHFEQVYAENRSAIKNRFRTQNAAAIALGVAVVALAVRAVAG